MTTRQQGKARDQHTKQDPRNEYRADNPETSEEHPGHTGEMDSQPDHGEETYRGSGRLQGRKALLTGGDSGIGRAIAIAFAREGADVCINHLPDEEDDAAETARYVKEAGRKVVAVPGDLRDEAFCTDLVERAEKGLGGLDIVVTNAAYQMSLEQGLASLTTEQLERTYRTNVFAMFWLCKAALPHLSPGSSIITTSSIQAYSPSPELIDYASTKGAIVNFTKCLARDLSERGIRVNSVAPGPIWTPLIPSTMSEEKVESFGKDTPLGRPGQPAELAPAYVFLASQESSYIAGEILGVTGGRLLA
jgi:NAD(P)-dependent dehydrogenase (short-subunit alcohol dehydrogenase family)